MNKPTRDGFPPGPPRRNGALGSLRYYWGFAVDPIGFVGQRFASYGDIYYAESGKGGRDRLFVLRRPEHMHEVLVTRAASFGKQHTAFRHLSSVLGDGLLISEGDLWTRHRRMINPGFTTTRVAAYGDVMVDEARRTGDRWRAGQTIALEKEMTSLTLRIVSRTLFGHDVGDEDGATIANAMNVFQRALLSSDVVPEWMPIVGRRRVEAARDALDRIVYRLIRDRQSSEGKTERRKEDLLQLLVDAVDTENPKAQTKLTEREVRDELVTLFLAGHETTSQALTWTFYCLSQSPEAERSLREEIDRVLGDRDPTYADLESLPYTEQVILEAMRVYPPVYLIARRAKEDTEVGGWRVPSGSEVICWVYWTHRDPTLYPNPDEFRPERFTKEEIAARPKLAYLPFGAGPRACIGRSFAMVEARLILATLCRRHHLALAKGQRRIRERPMITLTPNNGIRMKVLGRTTNR